LDAHPYHYFRKSNERASDEVKSRKQAKGSSRHSLEQFVDTVGKFGASRF